MIKILKAFYRDICSSTSRFYYLNTILSEIPGELGLTLRSYIIPRYFESAGDNVLVHRGSRFNGAEKIRVGNGVLIGVNNYYQASGGLSIGDHTIFGPDVKIWTLNHRFDSQDQLIKDQGYEYSPVDIGANVWFASDIFIMPGVEIPDDCVISAGSVVGVKKYPPGSIIAGNPARVIGFRTEKRSNRSS